MNILTIDIKTRSALSLQSVGVFAYAEHDSTVPVCFVLQENNDAPAVWLPPDLCRADIAGISSGTLLRMLERADRIEAFDIMTELAFWKYTLCRIFPWFPPVPLKKFCCIAAKAAQWGMPFSLRDLADELGVSCNSRRTGIVNWKIPAPGRAIPTAELVNFLERCKDNVALEHRVSMRLMDLPPEKWEIWRTFAAINDTGVAIDNDRLQEVRSRQEQEYSQFKEEFQAVTGLPSPMQEIKVLPYFQGHGVPLRSLALEEVQKVLPTLDNGLVKRALELRCLIVENLRKSPGPLQQMLSKDCRLRGMLNTGSAPEQLWSIKHKNLLPVLFDVMRPGDGRQFRAARFPDLAECVLVRLVHHTCRSVGVYSHQLLAACGEAVRKQGIFISFGQLKIICTGRSLKIKLPSDRELFLYQPQWDEQSGLSCKQCQNRHTVRQQISGGFLLRQIHNALQQDILTYSVVRLKDAGHTPILVTQDTIVCCDGKSTAVDDSFVEIIRCKPPWAQRIPYRVTHDVKQI